jgi:hypothetical protein
LFVAQTLSDPRALDELQALRFAIRYKLLKSEVLKSPGFNDRRHAAQFLFYLTIHHSAPGGGRGDYFWFGMNLYDSRRRFPPGYAALDRGRERKAGTGKFIYQPPAERFLDRSPHDGEWVTVDVDLLPLIQEGFAKTRASGYFADAPDLGACRLNRVVFGWEIPGTIDAAIALDDLRLDAVPLNRGSSAVSTN